MQCCRDFEFLKHLTYTYRSLLKINGARSTPPPKRTLILRKL